MPEKFYYTDTLDAIEKSKRVLAKAQSDQRRIQLLQELPQGEGSTLDADTLDGSHLQDILDSFQQKINAIPKRQGGGGGQPLLYGSGAPTVSGMEGLYYLDIDTEDLYYYTSAAWGIIDNLMGGGRTYRQVLSTAYLHV